MFFGGKAKTLHISMKIVVLFWPAAPSRRAIMNMILFFVAGGQIQWDLATDEVVAPELVGS